MFNGSANEVLETRVIARQPALLRFFAHFFSIVFHPLFIPGYVTLFLVFLHPYAYAGIPDRGRIFKFLSVFISTAFFPAFSVFLMKQLGFVGSITLKTQRDRIIPYIVSMIFYFWVWYVARNQVENPDSLVAFLLACFLGSIVALMANIYMKISMHGIAMGTMMAFFCWLPFTGDLSLGLYMMLAVLAGGLVCTARFIVSDHTQKEMYVGVLAGVLCMLVGVLIEG